MLSQIRILVRRYEELDDEDMTGDDKYFDKQLQLVQPSTTTIITVLAISTRAILPTLATQTTALPVITLEYSK